MEENAMRRTSELGASGYRNVGEFAPGMHWFQMAIPLQGLTHKLMMIDDPDWYDMGRTVQSLFNVFLIEDEQNVLIDQGPVQTENEVGEMVAETLDGDTLDYIVVTHPDVDHTGTLHEISEAHPDATVVAPGYGYEPELYYLDDAMSVRDGDTIDLGDHQLTFRDARLVDSAMTVWMTEETTGTFFTVDWLTYVVHDDEVGMYTDEIEKLDRGPVVDRQRYLVGHKYSWYPYADADRLTAEIDDMIESYQPEKLAPSHAPVLEDGAVEHLEDWKGIVEAYAGSELLGEVVA